MTDQAKPETCDYCDAPVAIYQNFGRIKTCLAHATRPHEEATKTPKPETKEAPRVNPPEPSTNPTRASVRPS